jgi:hypothetical protein
MAGLFAAGTDDTCRLLDAGVGIGALSDAFLWRRLAGGLGCQRVEVDAFEIDEALHAILSGDTCMGARRQCPSTWLHRGVLSTGLGGRCAHASPVDRAPLGSPID